MRGTQSVLAGVLACCLGVPAARATATPDQSQTRYDAGMSARTLPGYSVWQSFTAGRSGTLTEIDMGFFNDISGEARLDVHSGEGTGGALLQSLTVPVVARTGGGIAWNAWAVGVPVEAGRRYTFAITPISLPDPYGVAVGNGDSYEGGVLGLDDPAGSWLSPFDAMFATWVDSEGGGNAVQPDPVIAAGALPPAVAGWPYARDLRVTGGKGAFRWSLDDGGSGLAIGVDDGVLSGTPPTPGTFVLTVTGVDSQGTPARPVRRVLRVRDPLAASFRHARFEVGASGPPDRALDLPEGSILTVSATAPRGLPAPALELLDPAGNPYELGPDLRTEGRSVRLQGFVVPQTGPCALRVLPSTEDRTPPTRVTLSIRAPRARRGRR